MYQEEIDYRFAARLLDEYRRQCEWITSHNARNEELGIPPLRHLGQFVGNRLTRLHRQLDLYPEEALGASEYLNLYALDLSLNMANILAVQRMPHDALFYPISSPDHQLPLTERMALLEQSTRELHAFSTQLGAELLPLAMRLVLQAEIRALKAQYTSLLE
jgi:hypothetical protein